jgi:hypothetical protein
MCAAAFALLAVIQPGSNASEPGPAPDLPAPRLLSPAAGTRVPEPVTFEWSDVAGAAAYTIQIYKAPAPRKPLILDEKVSAPRFTANSLPAGPLWWRVRAIDATGAPGRWSVTRGFEPRPPPLAASVFSITLVPSSVPGGFPAQALVSLTAPAPAGGARVDLSTSEEAAATVPSHVVVTSGEKAVEFKVNTTAVAASRPVQISARSQQITRAATLTVVPPPPPAKLASFGIDPATLAGGGASEGTLMLTDAAPSPSGAVVEVAADDRTLAHVPATVIVPAGQRTAAFEIKTARVTISKSVRITVTAGPERMSAVLTLTAAATMDPLAAPELEHPAEGEALGYADLVWFRWSGVMGAASYTIEVDNSATFASEAMVSQTVPAPGVRIGPFARQDFWWRVRANDQNGAPGRWSVPHRFTVD